MMELKNKTLNDVGTRLKAWIGGEGVTICQLGKRIKISQGSISDLQNGKSLPSAFTLIHLHKKTNLNIIWLLIGEGNPHQIPKKKDSKGVTLLKRLILFVNNPKHKKLTEDLLEVCQRGRIKETRLVCNLLRVLSRNGRQQ